LPWRDFLGKYCNFYIIYKSWQYSLSIACQVWARGATWLESAVIAAISCKRSLLNSGLASQACPPSLPDIRQAGGRRVWAKKKALSVALLLKKEVSRMIKNH